jgi:hypothetical protein
MMMDKNEDYRIWEIRHRIAGERFGDNEYREMEIPGYSNSNSDLDLDLENELRIKSAEKAEDYRIWEIRHRIAGERFGDNEYREMEIPGYSNSDLDLDLGLENELRIESAEEAELKIYRENLEKRFNACKLRYVGMEEHMEIPDIDLWLNLKKEIFEKTRPKPLQRYRGCYHDGKEIEWNGGLCLEEIEWNGGLCLEDVSTESVEEEEEEEDPIDKAELRWLRFTDKMTSGGRRTKRRGDSF